MRRNSVTLNKRMGRRPMPGGRANLNVSMGKPLKAWVMRQAALRGVTAAQWVRELLDERKRMHEDALRVERKRHKGG